MKRHLIGIAVIAALGTAPAVAADMAFKAPAVPEPVWTWTGFYVGGNGGYSWGNWSSSSISPIFPGASTTANPSVDGWFGGLQAGYNWQVRRQWVIGVEGDYDWSSEKGRDGSSSGTSTTTSDPTGVGVGACDAHPTCTTTITTTTAGLTANQWNLPWFATLRARAGLLVDPTWLVYGTGGVAFAGTNFATSAAGSSTTTTTITNGIGQIVNPCPPCLAGGSPTVTSSALASTYYSQTSTRIGYAIGGGAEKMLSQNWSVKAEYLFLGFGSHTFLSGTGVDTNVKLIDNLVRLGVNYKFGG